MQSQEFPFRIFECELNTFSAFCFLRFLKLLHRSQIFTIAEILTASESFPMLRARHSRREQRRLSKMRICRLSTEFSRLQRLIERKHCRLIVSGNTIGRKSKPGRIFALVTRRRLISAAKSWKQSVYQSFLSNGGTLRSGTKSGARTSIRKCSV